jgi:transcriptional regulator with XRE-family HTH domain
MSNSLPSIDLKISEKLKDRGYRQNFFLAESSALIAQQLIALRRRRDLNQTEVAALIDTQQPAISRIERADYHNWSLNILRRLADALDARLRVIIQPSEDVISEYEEHPESAHTISVEDALKFLLDQKQDRQGHSDHPVSLETRGRNDNNLALSAAKPTPPMNQIKIGSNSTLLEESRTPAVHEPRKRNSKLLGDLEWSVAL